MVRVTRRFTDRKRDVKNTFMTGDELTIDSVNKRVLLNGKNFEGEMGLENRFYSVGMGDTKLQTIQSSWAQVPDGEVMWEERWL